MSRIPPQIEQIIDGKKVDGYHIHPITDGKSIFSLTSSHKHDDVGSPIGCDYFVSATDSTGEVLWKTEYFSKDFQPGLETDVQEVYPVDFFTEGDFLVIKHEFYTENERVYRIGKENGILKS